MTADTPNKKKIVLVAPSYSFIYKGAMIRPGAIYSPHLGLATIAGVLVSRGHHVRIIDLNKTGEGEFLEELRRFAPHYVGFGFTTILSQEALRLAGLVKDLDKNIIVVAGGVHPTSMPGEVLKSPAIDVVCIGEADRSIAEVVEGKPLESIAGIAFRRDGRDVIARRGEPERDLDSLPYPAWGLFELQEYRTTELLTRENPAGWIETSRGCPYECVYCNKNVFGRNFRAKSVKRVVDEMAYMLECGFREIHISDDCFTVDVERAKGICGEIIKRGLRFPWATVTGIRADRVDQELLDLMRRAGCYRVFFGIETGSDKILKTIRKGETCDDVRKAVRMAKKAGLEVHGFFMLALPGETEATMRETIDFAKELDLDMAKAAITVPLPSTPYFEQLERDGRIKTKDWSKYNLYFPARELYDLPNLDWDTVEAYYKKFYREFYFRPRFVWRRFCDSLARGRLLNDIKAFFQVKW